MLTRADQIKLALWHARYLRLNDHFLWRANHAWLLQLAADIRTRKVES
jgi:hypothetical protein